MDDNNKFNRQQEVLNCVIHCNDLINNTREFDKSKKRNECLTEKLFNQGDL